LHSHLSLYVTDGQTQDHAESSVLRYTWRKWDKMVEVLFCFHLAWP